MKRSKPTRQRIALMSSLMAAVMFAGCSNTDAEKQNGGGGDHIHHAEHPTVGPHGGILIEWGAHVYHVELVIDRAKQEATVYLLDGSLKKPKPIDAKEIILSTGNPSISIPLSAVPQGDPSGKSSRFIGKHEVLGGMEPLKGSVTGLADGTPYSGSFDESKTNEEAADHKDHDHKDHDHKDHDHDHKDEAHKEADHKDHDHE